jgi:hypothetical protein
MINEVVSKQMFTTTATTTTTTTTTLPRLLPKEAELFVWYQAVA